MINLQTVLMKQDKKFLFFPISNNFFSSTIKQSAKNTGRKRPRFTGLGLITS